MVLEKLCSITKKAQWIWFDRETSVEKGKKAQPRKQKLLKWFPSTAFLPNKCKPGLLAQVIVKRDTNKLGIFTVTKTAFRRIYKSVGIERAAILYRNEMAKEATVFRPVKANLHINNSLRYTWMISCEPSRCVCVTAISRNARCCHVGTRIITESIPRLGRGNQVTVATAG